MTSAASYQMAEAALNVLDPHLDRTDGRDVLQDQLRRQLVDYSYGEPPNVNESHSRHSLPPSGQYEIENYRRESRKNRETLLDYGDGQDPNLDSAHAAQQLVQYVTNQDSSPREEHIERPAPEAEVAQDQPVFADYVHSMHPQSPESPLQQNAAAMPVSESDSTMVDSTDTTLVWDTYNPTTSPVAVKKVRGAFALERRIAVKEVRKKGACLRCRMLKKSCDSEDPCNECAKLETARLWKGQCVRTRLTKIFDVYGSGLFMVLCHRALETARNFGQYEVRPGRLELRYFPVSGITVLFPYAIIHNRDGTSLPLINIDEDNQLSDKLTLGGRPLQYAARLLQIHQTSEMKIFKISKFMNATLSLALEMDQRVLIKKALELWACTTLMSFQPSDVTAFIDSSKSPADVLVEHTAKDTDMVPVDLIYLQLRRALEHCAETLFKIVMVELEKSLIQRKKADNFETFIGTIILLRCVEQICHLYHSFETSQKEEEDSKPSTSGNTYKSPYKAPPRDWPLDKPPHYFWQQGERFSDLLCSMLRLRRVPPKTETPDGVFIATDEPVKVAEWYEAIQLKVKTLEDAKRPFEAENENAWEFRWIGKAFLKFEA